MRKCGNELKVESGKLKVGSRRGSNFQFSIKKELQKNVINSGATGKCGKQHAKVVGFVCVPSGRKRYAEA